MSSNRSPPRYTLSYLLLKGSGGTLIRLPVGEEREVEGIELEYAEDPRSLEGKKDKSATYVD